MAATVQLNDRLLITFTGVANGQRVMNTFLYRCSAATGAPLMTTVLDEMVTKVKEAAGIFTKWRAAMPLGFICDDIWMQIIWPARFRKRVYPQGLAGQWDTALGTQNVQASITRVGEEAHRYDVGGIRLVTGTDDGAIDDGLLTVVAKGLYQTLATAMKLTIITTAGPTTWIPQVGVPKGTEEAPRFPGNSVDLYETIVQDEVRVMPRRTVGRGI